MTAVTGEVLAPLARRYASWLGLDEAQVREDREEAAQDIRALQLIVRMERDRPPSWHAAVALAATGSAAVCLDPRAEPGGQWHEEVAAYVRGHIRKVTRRGRGASWEAAADVPGLALTSGDTQILALRPGRVAELDKRVAKLQVGGTDVAIDDPLPYASTPRLRIRVPQALGMTLGKAMAQAGHAGMIAAALLAGTDPAGLQDWQAAGLPAVVEIVGRDAWDELLRRAADGARAWTDERLLVVRDAGFTEVAPGTVTVLAGFEP